MCLHEAKDSKLGWALGHKEHKFCPSIWTGEVRGPRVTLGHRVHKVRGLLGRVCLYFNFAEPNFEPHPHLIHRLEDVKPRGVSGDMAKKFDELRQDMSPERRERNAGGAATYKIHIPVTIETPAGGFPETATLVISVEADSIGGAVRKVSDQITGMVLKRLSQPVDARKGFQGLAEQNTRAREKARGPANRRTR